MKDKHLRVKAKDHTEIKMLALKGGKTILEFMSDLIKAYKGKSK